MAADQEQAIEALKAVKVLVKHGLKLKISKFQIMTDRKDMEGVKEIYGIEIKDSIKYLGITIYCDW